MTFSMNERILVGLIADEGMVHGFKMTGLVYNEKNPNFHMGNTNTNEEQLERQFEELVVREDITIVFVADFVAENIRDCMKKWRGLVPSVLTIPNKTGGA